jgi:hypothetical protein
MQSPEGLEDSPFQKKFFLDDHFFFPNKSDPKFFLSIQFFMYWKAKKIFRVLRKKFSLWIFFFTFQYINNWMDKKKIWITFVSEKKNW